MNAIGLNWYKSEMHSVTGADKGFPTETSLEASVGNIPTCSLDFCIFLLPTKRTL